MLLTALILGFTGSLHCLGMCSPLAMMVTGQSAKGFTKRLVYNSGRIVTYSVAGFIVASIGFVNSTYIGASGTQTSLPSRQWLHPEWVTRIGPCVVNVKV